MRLAPHALPPASCCHLPPAASSGQTLGPGTSSRRPNRHATCAHLYAACMRDALRQRCPTLHRAWGWVGLSTTAMRAAAYGGTAACHVAHSARPTLPCSFPPRPAFPASTQRLKVALESVPHASQAPTAPSSAPFRAPSGEPAACAGASRRPLSLTRPLSRAPPVPIAAAMHPRPPTRSPAGTVNPSPGSVLASACTPCQRGQYAPREGMAACRACKVWGGCRVFVSCAQSVASSSSLGNPLLPRLLPPGREF